MLTIDKLENIFKDLPVPALILAADEQFKILQANEAYVHVFGLVPKDIYGRPLFDVFPDQQIDDPQSPIKKTKQCIRRAILLKEPQTPGTIPYLLPDNNGQKRLRFWNLEYIPVADDAGTVAFIFQLTHEIVENNVAEKIQPAADLPYESIFETAQNAFFLSDKNGKVLAVNEAACVTFGYSEKELKKLGRQHVLQMDHALQQLLLQRERDGKVRGEVTALHRSGEKIPCEYSSAKFITPAGEERYCTEITDIRKWKHAQEKIRQSEENLRAIFDHTIEGFVLVDIRLQIIAFNEKAGDLIFEHGDNDAVEVGVSLLEYLPEDRRNVFKVIAQRALAGEAVEYEKAYPGADGKNCWFSFAINPVLENGTVTGLCISGRDISRQKQAEEKLIQSEEKYRKIFNLSPLPKWIYDTETLQILEVNDAAIEHYGYSRDEFLSMTLMDIRPPEDVAALKEVISGIKDNREKPAVYWRHIKKNGEIILVDVTGHSVDFYNHNARIIICRDVTETIKAEAELIRSNERFRQAARASSDAIWDWHIVTDNVFLGEGFSTLFGYNEAGTSVKRSWIEEKLHPDDRPIVAARIADVLSGKKHDRWQYEYRLKKADGTYAIICNSVVVVRDEEGNPLRIIGAMKDVTQQKEEEHHLKLMESVITNTTDAVIITATRFNKHGAPAVIYANPAFQKITGYTAGEIKRGGLTMLHGPETDMVQIAKLEEAMRLKQNCQIQAVFYKKSGQPYWASLAISPVTDADGNVQNYIAIERDITDRMDYLTAIEEQNKQLLEIAWVQSHMVRAPLARILGLIDLLINDTGGTYAKETLPMLKKSADDLDRIVREIIGKTHCTREG